MNIFRMVPKADPVKNLSSSFPLGNDFVKNSTFLPRASLPLPFSPLLVEWEICLLSDNRRFFYG